MNMSDRHMKQAFLPRFLKWGIRVERMELLNGIGFGNPEKVLYLPYEGESLRGSISSLNRVYGVGVEERDKRELVKEEAFDDLN